MVDKPAGIHVDYDTLQTRWDGVFAIGDNANMPASKAGVESLGDTLRLEYPLGLFRMAGATTEIPTAAGGFDPADGIPYEYFVDKTGFARPIHRRPENMAVPAWVLPSANNSSIYREGRLV